MENKVTCFILSCANGKFKHSVEELKIIKEGPKTITIGRYEYGVKMLKKENLDKIERLTILGASSIVIRMYSLSKDFDSIGKIMDEELSKIIDRLYSNALLEIENCKKIKEQLATPERYR